MVWPISMLTGTAAGAAALGPGPEGVPAASFSALSASCGCSLIWAATSLFGGGGHGALYRSGLGGSRGRRQSTLTLLLLQLLHALVDGLAHMVLHVLQIL